MAFTARLNGFRTTSLCRRRQATTDSVAHLCPTDTAVRRRDERPSRLKTTTARASCWPAPCAAMPTAGPRHQRSAWRFYQHDDGHRTAADYACQRRQDRGSDRHPRRTPPMPMIRSPCRAQVINTKGALGSHGVEVHSADGQRAPRCGALGVSGGWNPNVT